VHAAAALLAGNIDTEERTERDEAAEWLLGYLADNGGTADRKAVFKAAKGAGFSDATLKRAKDKARVRHQSSGFPRTTEWTVDVVAKPVGSPDTPSPQGEPTGEGEPTGADLREHEPQLPQSVQSAHPGGLSPLARGRGVIPTTSRTPKAAKAATTATKVPPKVPKIQALRRRDLRNLHGIFATSPNTASAAKRCSSTSPAATSVNAAGSRTKRTPQ
jgi:hypothetical protein